MRRDDTEDRSGLLAELSHELGNALTVLSSARATIARHARGTQDAALVAANGLTADGIERLSRLLEDIRAPSTDAAPGSVPPLSALERAIGAAAERAGCRVDLSVANGFALAPEAAGSVARFVERAIVGLAQIAPGEPVRVEARRSGRECVVTVGMPGEGPLPRLPPIVYGVRLANRLSGRSGYAPDARGVFVSWPA